VTVNFYNYSFHLIDQFYHNAGYFYNVFLLLLMILIALFISSLWAIGTRQLYPARTDVS